MPYGFGAYVVKRATLVKRGEIANYHLIAYSFSNIYAKNYQNWFMWIEVIVCNVTVVFLRHSVFDISWKEHPSASLPLNSLSYASTICCQYHVTHSCKFDAIKFMHFYAPSAKLINKAIYVWHHDYYRI